MHCEQPLEEGEVFFVVYALLNYVLTYGEILESEFGMRLVFAFLNNGALLFVQSCIVCLAGFLCYSKTVIKMAFGATLEVTSSNPRFLIQDSRYSE